MPPEIAARHRLELAAALDHAHGLGVIHRDVKPENVLVGTPSRSAPPASARATATSRSIKITDFGIAKLLDAQGVTSTGQVLGSPAHMAPEQIEGGDVTRAPTSSGSACCSTSAMVGQLPFDGKNPAQVLRRVLDGTFTPADRARPDGRRALEPHRVACACPRASRALGVVRRVFFGHAQELSRLGIDDSRRELGEFLTDAEAYRPDHEKRIVARLVELGREARRERKVAVAASCFNRALAFRPDDTELLAEVTRLARRERFKRNALRIGGIASVSVLLGSGAFALTRAFRPGVDATQPSTTVQVKPEPPRKTKSGPPTPSAIASAAAREEEIKCSNRAGGRLGRSRKGGDAAGEGHHQRRWRASSDRR